VDLSGDVAFHAAHDRILRQALSSAPFDIGAGRRSEKSSTHRVGYSYVPADLAGKERGTVDPMALAILAAQTLVTAASTDAWGVLKRGVVRLLGRGDAEREQLAMSQLDETWQQIQAAQGHESEHPGAALEAAWQARLFSLLEAQPDVAEDLLELVEKVRTATGTIAATDHSIAGARDVTITASQGGVAAGVIHGKVSPGPTLPGPANN
jgi:hypothetical protein